MSLNDIDQDHEFMVDHFLGPDDEPAVKKPKKNSKVGLRKAPNAPKRFKSSYICFFMAKQSVIKEELGPDSTVANISKRSAELWKTLTAEERAVWDDVACQDKKRYLMEKANYTGPWQVPWKRVKKDPSAPKRPMSAFLYFSQGKRAEIKKERPEIKNTEVSRVLGEMWRNLSDEERTPHVERERKEREVYKVAIAEWREHNDAMKRLGGGPNDYREIGGSIDHHDIHIDPLGNQYAMQGHQIMPLSQHQFPTNGKQLVILGPKGIPYVAAAPVSPFVNQQPNPNMPVAPLMMQPTPTFAPVTATMFDDVVNNNIDTNNVGIGSSLMTPFHHSNHHLHHGGYDFSNDHMGGDPSSNM